MSDEVKSSVWDIEVLQTVLHKGVVFSEPVTEEEAIDMFLDEAYEDVLDLEFLTVDRVIEAIPMEDAAIDEEFQETDEE